MIDIKLRNVKVEDFHQMVKLLPNGKNFCATTYDSYVK